MSDSRKFDDILKQIEENPKSVIELVQTIDVNCFDDVQINQIFLTAIKHNTDVIHYLPQNRLNSDFILSAIKQNNIKVLAEIQYMISNNNNISYDAWLELIKNDVVDLEYIKKEMRDHEMCRAAVGKPGRQLRYIVEYKNDSVLTLSEFKDVCMRALSNNPFSIQYVPIGLFDNNIYPEIMSRDWRVINYIPEEFIEINESIINCCKKDIKENPSNMQYLHEKLLSASEDVWDACYEVIRANGLNLKYFPAKLKTTKLCMLAVQQNLKAFDYVSPDLLDEDLYLIAIKNMGCELSLVPDNMCSMKICLPAIEKNPSSIRFLQEPQRRVALNGKEYSTLCQKALQKNPCLFLYVDQKYVDEETYLLAIKQKGDLLEHVPVTMRTETLCLEAIKQDWRLIQYVPVMMRTKALWLETIKQFTDTTFSHQFVPEYQFQHPFQYLIPKKAETAESDVEFSELYIDWIKQNPYVIHHIACESYHVCLEAICNKGYLFRLLQDAEGDKTISTKDFLELFAYILKAVPNSDKLLLDFPTDLRNSEKLLKKMCLLAVKYNRYALAYVPKYLRTEAVCMEAARAFSGSSNDNEIESILQIIQPIESESALTSDQFKHVCLEAFKYDERNLKYIPENLRNEAMYLFGVTRNGLLIECAPPKLITKKLCQIAIENPKALKFINMKTSQLNLNEYKEICIQAAKKNIEVIDYISIDVSIYDVLLEVIKQYGNKSKSIVQKIQSSENKYHLNENQCKELFFAAVERDVMSLEFIPENLKVEIIQSLTVEKILYMNYKARNFFPKSHDFQPEIDKFLSSIKTVVVSKENEFNKDSEVKDIYLVYAHHPKRIGKIIHTESDDIENLFNHLQIVNLNKNDYKVILVLLDHANQKSVTLSNMNIDIILMFIEKYTSINELILLGCFTIEVSEKLNQEIILIEQLSLDSAKTIETIEHKAYGFIAVSRVVAENEYQILMKKVSVDKDKKKIDKCYIISKIETDKDIRYELVVLQQKNGTENNTLDNIRYSINDYEIPGLQSKITSGKGAKFSFPRNKTETLYIRGGSGQRSLNEKELAAINSLISDEKIFNRDHPDYKATKSQHLSLQCIPMQSDEVYKLTNSIATKMYTEASALSRSITIKAYPGLVSVDAKNKMLRVTKNGIYNVEYKPANTIPPNRLAFFNKTNTIDRTRFKAQMKLIMGFIRNGNTTGKTAAKSIKLKTQPRKKP